MADHAAKTVLLKALGLLVHIPGSLAQKSAVASGGTGQPQRVRLCRTSGIGLGAGTDHDAGKLAGIHGDVHAAGLFALRGISAHRAEGKTLIKPLGSLAENSQRGIIKQEAVLLLGEGLFEKGLRGKAVREEHALSLPQLFVQQLLCLRRVP